MKAPLQRDGILTVLGVGLTTGLFLFAFYLPGIKVQAQVKQEIKGAEEAVRNIPMRVAEIEALQSDVARRRNYLVNARVCVPVDPDVHTVIHQVAELARNSDLQITRLEPRTPIIRGTYQEIPFRLSFSGSFREMAAFLKGLESRERLFTVQQFTTKQKDGKNGRSVEADMNFSVFIGHAEVSDFAGNNGRATPEMADTKKAGESK